jgi:ankyrin repeat protein
MGSDQEHQLRALLVAIARHDRDESRRLLEAGPALARRVALVGATRQQASEHYFKEIERYVFGGDTALHFAAAAYERDVAELLVKSGADVSARNRRGAQPLHYAVEGIPGSAMWNPEAQYATVRWLIAAGAVPNALDKSGVAPLHRAVRARSAAAVRALLEQGADALQPNKGGSTPLHLAAQATGRGDTGSAIARQQQREIIRLLLAHGARPMDDALELALAKLGTNDA